MTGTGLFFLGRRKKATDSAVVSMGFQKLCHLLDIFLDCSRSPCRSLLISKPTLWKTILSSSFVLELRTKTDKLFYSSLKTFTSKIQRKTVSTIQVDHDFCQIASLRTRARFFLCPLIPSACYAGYQIA